jgi:hypothetical protein
VRSCTPPMCLSLWLAGADRSRSLTGTPSALGIIYELLEAGMSIAQATDRSSVKALV